MTPERRERIKELFEGALERNVPERARFLAGACGSDADLFDAVVQLLDRHESAGDFGEHSPFPAPQFDFTSDRARAVFSADQVVAGRFRIVKTLGHGGMGEVYEAFDLELRDSVALKTIRHDIGSDPRFIERFKREVQGSRTISHSNVCRVHDLFRERGTDDMDVWFLTMELLRGETLGDRIRRERRLSTGAAFPVVKQLCAALDAAHHSGVVHRDFKSANIMLVSDPVDSAIRVVVTDFGLARQISASRLSTGTLGDLGNAVGTPAYMAPEQLEGKPASVASDLYSLGVVMYEIVTGTRPFAADSALSVAVQCLTGPPITPRAHVPDLDLRWEQTIMRCLERDPAARFTSAGQVAAALDGSMPAARIAELAERELRSITPNGPSKMPPPLVGRVRGGPTVLRGRVVTLAAGVVLALLLLFKLFNSPAQAVSSIAVVPFLNDGGDSAFEYLSDGVTEGIIDHLAQLPQPTLKVIALNSVRRYKGREIDAKAIGRELKVGAVVIGKVMQRSDGLSVRAELVNTRDQSHMWGKTYNAALSDLPTVHEEIAGKIAETLKLRVSGNQERRLTKRSTDNTEAYRLYLKGRYFWNKYTEEGWNKAIEFFNQAIEIDPNYALAWAGLADSYYQLSNNVLPPAEAIPRARAAATRALAIDDNLAEAHASLGIIKAQYDWDASGAEKEFKRAIEVNSNYATGHLWYGVHLYATGQFEAAQSELNKAQELDPLSLTIAVTAVWPLRPLGQDDLAVGQIEKITEMFPDVPDLLDYLHEVRGEIYLQKRMYDEAVAELLIGWRVKALCGRSPGTIDALQRAYTTSGLDGYWEKQLELATRRYQERLEAARKQPSHRYVSPFRLAELNARVGDKERAFALLQESYKNRDENLRWLKAESSTAGSPWESIRAEPRFSAMLRAVGLGG